MFYAVKCQPRKIKKVHFYYCSRTLGIFSTKSNEMLHELDNDRKKKAQIFSPLAQKLEQLRKGF